MEFNISDLLDEMQENSIEIQTIDIASSHRIKELTMKKIHKNKPKRSHRRFVILVAAVIVTISLAITAGANSDFNAADWFADFLGASGQEERQAINDLAMEPVAAATGASSEKTAPVFELPQTSEAPNGSRVTLLSAVGGIRRCYLKLRFEAPEGTVLAIPDPDTDGWLQLDGDQAEEWDEKGLPLGILRCEEYRPGYTYDMEWVDETEGDNVLDLFLSIKGYESGALYFNDGAAKTLKINALYVQDPYKVYTRLLEGPWEFQLGNCNATESYVNVDSITAPGSYDSTIVMKSMTISQLEMKYLYTYTPAMTDSGVTGTGPAVEVFLKDGTQLEFSGGNYSPEGYSYAISCLYFAKPIQLDSIDYIQIGDTKISYADNLLSEPANVEIPVPDPITPMTVTDSGTTVTLKGAAGIDDQCWLHLRFEAPVGTVLEGSALTLGGKELLHSDKYYNLNYSTNVQWRDVTPGDNILDAYITMNTEIGTQLSFMDCVEKQLTIDGLYDGDTRILDGTWTFDLTDLSLSSFDFDVTGKKVTAENGEQVILEMFRLSPFSINVSYNYVTAMTSLTGDIVITMNDGEVVTLPYPGGESQTEYGAMGHAEIPYIIDVYQVKTIQFAGLTLTLENAARMTK